MTRRLRDQALVLEAIGEVRRELKPCMGTIEQAEVLTRLATLYSLLDVTRLKSLVENNNEREHDSPNKEAA